MIYHGSSVRWKEVSLVLSSAQLLQIIASTEGAPDPMQDDGTNRLIIIQFLEGLNKLLSSCVIHAVALGRPVDPNRGDWPNSVPDDVCGEGDIITWNLE